MSFLKHCPFCASLRIKAHYIRDGQSLGCRDCGASVRAYNPNAVDKCIELWNRRERQSSADVLCPVEASPYMVEAMTVIAECMIEAVGKIDVGLIYATGVRAAETEGQRVAEETSL